MNKEELINITCPITCQIFLNPVKLSDGYTYEKEAIIQWLSDQDIPVIDFGPDSTESVDYPDYAHAVTSSILDEESVIGILICGSGNGICMTANKWRDIRAALCWNSEIASLARQHNNANVLVLGARITEKDEALRCVSIFLE